MDESKATTATQAARVSEETVLDRPQETPTAKALDEWGKVRALALGHLDRFISFEPTVLRGNDPDAIHGLRVASRRLQQVLDLLYPPPGPGEVHRLRQKVRRARRALSDTRNCDVLIQKVESHRRRKRAARREIWTAVEDFIRERRAEHFERALRKLSKVNLAVFYIHLKRYLVPEDGGPPHHAQAVALTQSLGPADFYQRISESLEKVYGAFRSQVEFAERDARAPIIHGVRIAAKRLRYLIEVFEEFEVAGSPDALVWLRGLQQHLGNWHDLEVLEEVMIEMVARREFLRDHLDLALGVEKLILRNREIKRGFLDKYFRLLGEPEGTRRLNDWVAYVLASPSAAFARA